MGWSCGAKAGNVMDAWMDACYNQTGQQNVFLSGGYKYFFEVSNKEHRDGAITGTIWKYLPDGEHVRRSGTFRIEGNGKVTRAPAFLKKVEVQHPQIVNTGNGFFQVE